LHVTGLVFNGSQLVQAVRDYVYVKKKKINSIREYAATTTFLMFASWTLVQFVFVVIGFLAMLVESPNNVVSPVSYVLTMAFVVVSALLAVSGYITNARRQALIKKIAEIENFKEE
jgi:hypothetical protein